MLVQVQELMQFQLKLLLWYDLFDQLTSTEEKRNCERWQNNKVKNYFLMILRSI